ncbi:hypothetical protein AB0D49_38230 [Streptomyces sp. NPDC048290]|uniref:hypothetical protein n=1 Tax=Streptomyces sp. NPDC048290 TaxID=3155811 RepID=UPI003416F985
MSDASMSEPLSADAAEESAGHGRHRGQVASQDAESAPSGRHRKPVDQTTVNAA